MTLRETLKQSLGGRRVVHQFTDGSSFPPGSNGVAISNLSSIFQESITSSRALLEIDFPTSSFSNIFNDTLENTQQSNRKQRILTKKEINGNPFLSRLASEMIYHAKQINEKYNSVGQMQILFSEPGCEKQAPHIDEEPGTGRQFISSIFTVHDETIIYLNEKRVVLSSCNLISIHSTTTHNGGENLSSSHGNIRIHAYVGTKGTNFVPRNSVGVNDLRCRYAEFGCSLTFGSNGKKYYHHGRCGFNPNNTIQKINEAKKRRSVYNKKYYDKTSKAKSRL